MTTHSSTQSTFMAHDRVIARTTDTFNGKHGTVSKIVVGPRPAYYVQLDDASFKDLLYFSGAELEGSAQPKQASEIVKAVRRSQAVRRTHQQAGAK